MTVIRWNGSDVALNDDEADFLAGLKSQHASGEITAAELAAQVKTLMGLKTRFDATMLDRKTSEALGL